MTVLVSTTVWKPSFSPIAPPITSQTGRTQSSENPPLSSLGVATTMNVISERRTASCRSWSP